MDKMKKIKKIGENYRIYDGESGVYSPQTEIDEIRKKLNEIIATLNSLKK